MLIDVAHEDLIHFPEAAKEFPGRAPSLQTLHRWRLKGVRGVRLETAIVGGLRYTSREAIARFIAAQNADDTPSLPITDARRAKQDEAAKSRLVAMGAAR